MSPTRTPAEYPTTLYENVETLPDQVEQQPLDSRGLEVVAGLTAALAEQLVRCSTQPHIEKYCPNDATARFADLDTVAAWQAKGRLALPLVRGTGDGTWLLAGFAWMGPARPGPDEPELPGAATTFAIRIYQDAQGQGHALPYTRAVLAAHDLLYGNRGVWLEAWGDNPAALRTYEKAGFRRVAEIAGTRHGCRVPRVYMTL